MYLYIVVPYLVHSCNVDHVLLFCSTLDSTEAPTVVRVNIYLRSISKIDDYKMVSVRWGSKHHTPCSFIFSIAIISFFVSFVPVFIFTTAKYHRFQLYTLYINLRFFKLWGTSYLRCLISRKLGIIKVIIITYMFKSYNNDNLLMWTIFYYNFYTCDFYYSILLWNEALFCLLFFFSFCFFLSPLSNGNFGSEFYL